MSLQFLNERGVTRIDRGDRGEIEVELTVQGGPARLVLEGTTEDYVPVGHPKTPLELVAALQGPARVVACPLGDRFPDGTTVQFTVRSQAGGRVSQVVGPRLDIGALPRVALAEIVPRDEQFTSVEALRFGFGGPSEGLTELGRATHSVARGLAWSGVADRAPDGLTVVMDGSASMLGYCRSGLLQLLIEVALGVDRGLGDGGSVPVFAVGAKVTRLEPISQDNAASFVSQHFQDAACATGFRPSLLLGRQLVTPAPSLVLLITDAVPADMGQLWRGLCADPSVTRWRLVVLAPADATDAGAIWADDVGCIDPEAWNREVLMADREQLQSLVLALVGRSRGTHQED